MSPTHADTETTQWALVSPAPNTWITTTQGITVEVLVSDSLGFDPNFLAIYNLNNSPNSLFAETMTETAQTLRLKAPITLTQENTNTIRFQVRIKGASSTTEKSFTLLGDTLPPMLTKFMPDQNAHPKTGDKTQVQWTFVETGSGILTPTTISLTLAPDTQPILLGHTDSNTFTWPVTFTQKSTQTQIHLSFQDVAGNRSVFSSERFNLNITPTLYLPFVASPEAPKPCDQLATDCFEPNNTALTAYGPIATGITYTTRIDKSTDASDYFSITLSSGVKYVIKTNIVSSTNGKQDIDLYLYDKPNHIIQQSDQLSSGDETITFQPALTTPTQLFYIRIYAFNAENTIYQLKVN